MRPTSIPQQSKGLTRREFLGRSGQAWAFLIAAPLRGRWLTSEYAQDIPSTAAGSGLGDYRLKPNYRIAPPLEDVFRNTEPGLDAYPTEKYAAELEAILAQWGEALCQFPADFRPLESSLSPVLVASPLTPLGDEVVRSDTTFEVRRVLFPKTRSVARDTFVSQLRSLANPLSRLLTTEFKIPSLNVISSSPLAVQTLVRYDFVVSWPDFHREERLGEWHIEWEQSSNGEWRVGKWQALEETSCRATSPMFVDITAQAFEGNASYKAQLLRGTDHWRTVLDVASGIDIYGNVGIACGDIDNDGFDDLYVCQPSGLPNRLYRNRGDGTFEDVTEAAGVGVLDNTPCALFADVNNDGLQDLLVIRATGPLLFLNQGNGRFRVNPHAFRFAQEPQGTFTGAAFGDYDRDGWLDVYLCLYSYYQGLNQYRFPTPYYDAQNGPPNFLFRNNRDGTFADVTSRSGLNQNNNRYSFDCHWADYDNDGWPDLYVVNDFGRKNLYHNNGDGTFTDVAEEAGVLDIGPGMSACWFDYDNDGQLDLYVSNMWEAAGLRVGMQHAFSREMPADVHALYRRHAKGNSLFRNLGNGRFEERGASAGVERSGWSWSNHAWDFDHDGYPDLYIANGMISGPSQPDLESFFWRQVVSHSPLGEHPSQRYERGWNSINELIRSDGTWAGYQRNVFYLNNRDGTFTYCGGAVGLDFHDDSRAFALADFDHDGRLEIFLKNRTGPQLRLLCCESTRLGNSIAFRLRGTKSNRDAIGAVVTLETEQGTQTRLLQAGTGFCSQHSKEIFFGVGRSNGPVRARIHWPSGRLQEFTGLPINHRIEIEEGSEIFRAVPFRASPRQADPPAAQPILPLPTSCETWLLDPVMAPDFELSDLAGRRHRLTHFRGQRVLLNLWALGSPTSLSDLEKFEEFRLRWLADKTQLIAVNVDAPDAADGVRAFLHSKQFSFLTLFASEDFTGVYSILYRYMFDRRRDLGIPTSFLIDEEGQVVKIYQRALNLQALERDLGGMPKSPEERRRRGLPFPGVFFGDAFRRNHFTYGVAFFQRGYLDEAIAAFRRVVAQDPQHADAHYNLGTLYLSKKMSADARGHLLRAVEIRPGYADALNNLGLLAAEEGNSQEAVRYFEAALQRNPDYSIALQNLGNLYRREGRFHPARAALERAVKLDPEDAEANYSLGMLFAQQNDPETARRYLETALRLRPAYPEALNNLGVLNMLTGKPAEALANFQECIRVAPDFDQPYINLARAYVSRGEQQKAEAILRQLLARNPDHELARKALEQIGR